MYLSSKRIQTDVVFKEKVNTVVWLHLMMNTTQIAETNSLLVALAVLLGRSFLALSGYGRHLAGFALGHFGYFLPLVAPAAFALLRLLLLLLVLLLLSLLLGFDDGAGRECG